MLGEMLDAFEDTIDSRFNALDFREGRIAFQLSNLTWRIY